jgi:hypothetical protein
MHSRWNPWVLAGVGLLAGLTGCSSNSNDDGSATTAAVVTTAAPTTAPPTTVAPTTVPATSVAPTTVPATTVAPTTTFDHTGFDEAAARTAVTKMWQTFLDKDSSVEARKAVLENGTAHAASVAAVGTNPFIGQANGVVKKVTFTSKQRADVVYDITVSGAVALADAQGVAVFVDGQWKVSEETFCGLVALAISPLPADCA